jgi:quinoprotein glucose dehydrogenase
MPLKKSFLLLISIPFFFGTPQKPNEWTEYLGGPDRNHFSSLRQINTQNVKQLQKVWEFHTNDSSGQMQCNPIIVHGVMYASTASIQIIALDAATGKELWRHTDASDAKWYSTNRGVTYWEKNNDKRILFTAGNWLYALDALTGKKISQFGSDGRIDIRMGLGITASNKFVISSTPGTIFEDKIIMPLRLSEGADAALGYIQAFNIISGKLDWVFKTIPSPGEFGYNTWEKENYLNKNVGAANNWSGMSIDRKRAMLFVPTGSAGFDFYGGQRKGQNLFANTLLALDARTGKRIWHYQLVHHDVWDRDLPAPPNLVTLNVHGKKVDAVAQITKQGYVYVFERETGKPVFPIDEIKVNTNGLPGEVLWPTQPKPRTPNAFARNYLNENDISVIAPNRDELQRIFRSIRKNPFDPPAKEGSLIFPGFDGGGEWGGASFDPETGYLYVNACEMPYILKMVDAPLQSQLKNMTPGELVYTKNCVTCHQQNLQGNPKSGYPSLVNIGQRKEKSYIQDVITHGKGMMPGFTSLNQSQTQAVIEYLLKVEKIKAGALSPKENKKSEMSFNMTGYNKFLDSNGYPAINPPWGTLTAINLNTGDFVWRKTLGEFKELTAKGIPQTGTENYGGGVVTAGGLFFIGATKDEMFRAFNKLTGELMWQTELPASAFATPSTYEVNGKQFVVIACGGTKLGTKKGDSYVAFALGEK